MAIQRSSVATISAITHSVTTYSTTRPVPPYSPVCSAMMPTRLKRKLPRKVASAFCEVVSAVSSRVARGVTLLVADASAATSVLSEKMVTDSMLAARMLSRLSTASAPILPGMSSGI